MKIEQELLADTLHPVERGALGFVMLLSFVCDISVNKIQPDRGIAVKSNSTVYDVCVVKPTFLG